MSGNEPITLVSFWLSWLHNARLLVNKMVNCDHRGSLRQVHHLFREGAGGRGKLWRGGRGFSPQTSSQERCHVFLYYPKYPRKKNLPAPTGPPPPTNRLPRRPTTTPS